jgi:hypothetical protein
MVRAAMNMVSAGVFGVKLSFKKMSAGGRLCTYQENPHFWVPSIKVGPPDGSSTFVFLEAFIDPSLQATFCGKTDSERRGRWHT